MIQTISTGINPKRILSHWHIQPSASDSSVITHTIDSDIFLPFCIVLISERVTIVQHFSASARAAQFQLAEGRKETQHSHADVTSLTRSLVAE